MKLAVVLGFATTLALTAPASAQIEPFLSGNVVKIGVLTDMSSLYADIGGPGSVEAARMAIADFGGSVNGKKIELVNADHHNKPDLGAAIPISGSAMTASTRSPTWRPRVLPSPSRRSRITATRCC
jgi:branched-chain amino acid transport system substrate-binding protein